MDKKSIPMTSKVEEISMLEQSIIRKDEMQLPVQFAVKRRDQSGSSTGDTVDNMILTNAAIKEIKGTHPLPKVYGYMKRKLILFLFDTSATHNFISQKTMRELYIQSHASEIVAIKLATGKVETSSHQLSN
jgi:hypothetical protein